MAVIAFLIAAVVAVALLVGVIGVVAGVIGLALKLLPIVIIGYIVVKVVQRLERPSGGAMTTTSRDSSWLDTRD